MNSKQTKTGDLVQVSECKDKEVTYGIISIHLKKRFAHLHQAETVLTEFMLQLQPTFAVQHTTGIQVDYEPTQTKIAITDYWQDVEGCDWKVKGWTDGKTMAVLYIRNISQVPIAQEMYFLNGAPFADTRI